MLKFITQNFNVLSLQLNKHITVLIIDDDEDDVYFFMEAVKEVDNSIKCISSNNAIEALALLKRKDTYRPDFIFLDLNMPRMNGRQCLSEIKKIDSLFRIPVFIYSTSNTEDTKELKQLGATDYFTKPYRFTELLSLVQEVLVNK